MSFRAFYIHICGICFYLQYWYESKSFQVLSDANLAVTRVRPDFILIADTVQTCVDRLVRKYAVDLLFDAEFKRKFETVLQDALTGLIPDETVVGIEQVFDKQEQLLGNPTVIEGDPVDFTQYDADYVASLSPPTPTPPPVEHTSAVVIETATATAEVPPIVIAQPVKGVPVPVVLPATAAPKVVSPTPPPAALTPSFPVIQPLHAFSQPPLDDDKTLAGRALFDGDKVVGEPFHIILGGVRFTVKLFERRLTSGKTRLMHWVESSAATYIGLRRPETAKPVREAAAIEIEVAMEEALDANCVNTVEFRLRFGVVMNNLIGLLKPTYAIGDQMSIYELFNPLYDVVKECAGLQPKTTLGVENPLAHAPVVAVTAPRKEEQLILPLDEVSPIMNGHVDPETVIVPPDEPTHACTSPDTVKVLPFVKKGKPDVDKLGQLLAEFKPVAAELKSMVDPDSKVFRALGLLESSLEVSTQMVRDNHIGSAILLFETGLSEASKLLNQAVFDDEPHSVEVADAVGDLAQLFCPEYDEIKAEPARPEIKEPRKLVIEISPGDTDLHILVKAAGLTTSNLYVES